MHSVPAEVAFLVHGRTDKCDIYYYLAAVKERFLALHRPLHKHHLIRIKYQIKPLRDGPIEWRICISPNAPVIFIPALNINMKGRGSASEPEG